MKTNGDLKWKERVDKLVTYGLETFFPDEIATEISCELHDACKTDMFTYKGFVHRWYSVITQVAPFTAQQILPVLEKSAQAAIDQCTGGDNGRQCGLRWSDGTYDGHTGAGQEMSALAAVQSLLIVNANAPVTAKSGGTSTDNPDGGGDDGSIRVFEPLTMGDRAGAGVITVLMLGLACGVFGWISV